MPDIDSAGRQIAGLLTYNPGPGIYSRLERAIQQMPENVRVQELPGLIKRHKEGVPGWELRETDLDSIIAGRAVVPRSELLARVQERSPVYTHGEVVLGGRPAQQTKLDHTPEQIAWLRQEYPNQNWTAKEYRQPVLDSEPLPLGKFDGVSHGNTKYEDYGQGGEEYSELLLVQPGARSAEYGNHWRGLDVEGAADAVAHARFDTHGDALRINELQSDLGIHNRKQREYANQNPQIHFGERLNPPEQAGLPFPLEDAWADLLIKRLALEAARKGHRAIEVASPRAIADKVGGNIDNYEHFYGKVVPGALERLGRKMGGLAEDAPPDFAKYDDLQRTYAAGLGREEDDWRNLVDAAIDRVIPAGREGRASHQLGPTVREMERKLGMSGGSLPGDARDAAYRMFQVVARQHMGGGANHAQAAAEALRDAMPYLGRAVGAGDDYYMAKQAIRGAPTQPAAKRYIMSDEMRRRLIEQGVGASLLAPLLLREE